MIVGTSHFVSLKAAVDYYRPYGENRASVLRKLKDREIHIHRPRLRPNERLVMLDGGKRYGIADDGPLSPRDRCRDALISAPDGE